MRILGLVIVILCGSILIYHTSDFPDWGHPASPASTHVSPYYIEKALDDTAVPNIVTAVLSDYRGYDTMFETTVIFCAGIACFFLLRITKRMEPSVTLYRHLPTGITLRIEKGGKEPDDSNIFKRIDTQWVPYDLIINTTCRMIIPFIQLFALYVISHGHHSPGGGFQGGVILGASVILFAISTDLRTAISRMSERLGAFLSATGVFIYAGAGALCLVLGANFLDYSALAPVLNVNSVMARSHGILIVEIGVGLAVMAVMIWIYYNLSSAGRHDEGL
ncbi:MAG: Na(+)/H(+) antiporter subunit B [Deltaproteobacteria bacterium]|nr:Na(+)/H(+) antiporter subunit B [Deltaproteobacteria bacterium]